jgi:hypothetical protein
VDSLSSEHQIRIRLSVDTARRACSLATAQPFAVKFSTFFRVSCKGMSFSQDSIKSLNCPTASHIKHVNLAIFPSASKSLGHPKNIQGRPPTPHQPFMLLTMRGPQSLRHGCDHGMCYTVTNTRHQHGARDILQYVELQPPT